MEIMLSTVTIMGGGSSAEPSTVQALQSGPWDEQWSLWGLLYVIPIP